MVFQKLSVSYFLKKHLFRKCFTSKLYSILANIIENMQKAVLIGVFCIAYYNVMYDVSNVSQFVL